MLFSATVGSDDDIGEGFSNGKECRGHRAIIAGFSGQGERVALQQWSKAVTMVLMQHPNDAPAPRPKSHYSRPTKKNTSLRNIVWALGLTMAIVIVVGFAFFGAGDDAARDTLPGTELDVAASAERAQDAAPFPVAVPDTGQEWEARSARYSGGQEHWEIRYTSPQGALVSMAQVPEVSAAVLSASVPGAAVQEDREIAGIPCQVLSGGTDEESQSGLSCAGEGWGLLVHGKTDVDELETLAEAAITSIR